LDRLRNNWLNPPEWTREQVLEFPGTVGGPWDRYIDRGTVRWVECPHPGPLPKGEGAKGPHPGPLPEGEGGKSPHPGPFPEGEGAKGPHPRPLSRERERGVGIGTVRYPRIVAKDEECAKELKKRTLTNLYNERPTWLELAHRKLDEAVFAAYGWDAGMSDEALLEKLLELNLERAKGEGGRRKADG